MLYRILCESSRAKIILYRTTVIWPTVWGSFRWMQRKWDSFTLFFVAKMMDGSNLQFESAGFDDGCLRKSSESIYEPMYLTDYYLNDLLGDSWMVCDYSGELMALRDYYPLGKSLDSLNNNSPPIAAITTGRNGRRSGVPVCWTTELASTTPTSRAGLYRIRILWRRSITVWVCMRVAWIIRLNRSVQMEGGYLVPGAS